MQKFIFLFIIASFAFINIYAQTNVENNVSEIRKLEKQWLIESYKTGDMRNFDQIVSEDFLITHSNGKVLNKAEKRADIIKNQIKEALPEDIFQIDDKSTRVTFHNKQTAVSKGYIIENYVWRGKRYLDHVHFTNTYLKQDGKWQVISCHLTRLNQKQFTTPPKEVSFKSSDDVLLFGDIYESPKGKNAPLIMLFHQGGGDARGEYKPLIPTLLAQNYNVIAVDLRTGGNRFGSENRTVNKLGDKKYGYCDAYPDLEATLRYANSQGFTGKKIAWGSSFSAALVFQLAVNYEKDLAGILAFSPASGDPMKSCKPSLYASGVKIPVLALRPQSEMQRETSQNQFKIFKANNIQTYISANGVHGSSMLNSERVEGSVKEHWKAVLTFIKQTLKTAE